MLDFCAGFVAGAIAGSITIAGLFIVVIIAILKMHKKAKALGIQIEEPK